MTDAYYTVPVASEHRKYLRFIWGGELFSTENTCGSYGVANYLSVLVCPMAYPQHLDILPSSLSQYMVYYLVKNKGNFEALMQLQKLGKILVGG